MTHLSCYQLRSGLWSPVMHGMPIESFSSLAVDWTTTPQTIYVATDSQVYIYRSTDDGENWGTVSDGLPRRMHIVDMDFAMEEGHRRLYIATYGRSVWSAVPD